MVCRAGARDLVTAIFLFLAHSVLGQDVAIIQPGDVHIQSSGGFNFIGGVNRVSTTTVSPGLAPATYLTPNTNGIIGVQLDRSITRRIAIQADYSYLAGGSLIFNQDYINLETPPRIRRVAITAHSSARIIGASVLVRFPLQRSPRVVPYASSGVGLVRTSFELSQAIIGNEVQAPAGELGSTFSGSNVGNDLGGSVSGGLRYYFTERLGLTGDLKLFAGPGVRTIARFTVGFFVKVY